MYAALKGVSPEDIDREVRVRVRVRVRVQIGARVRVRPNAVALIMALDVHTSLVLPCTLHTPMAAYYHPHCCRMLSNGIQTHTLSSRWTQSSGPLTCTTSARPDDIPQPYS